MLKSAEDQYVVDFRVITLLMAMLRPTSSLSPKPSELRGLEVDEGSRDDILKERKEVRKLRVRELSRNKRLGTKGVP